MTVRNIELFHGSARETLESLGTRHLVNILESARKMRRCKCSPWCDYVHPDDEVFNLAQSALKDMVKDILRTRDHLIRGPVRHRKPEKKVMKH